MTDCDTSSEHARTKIIMIIGTHYSVACQREEKSCNDQREGEICLNLQEIKWTWLERESREAF